MSIVHVGVKSHGPGENSLIVHLTNNYKIHERNIFHIIFEKLQGLKIPHTWQIVPGRQDIPEEGLPRLNLPGFSGKDLYVDENTQYLCIRGKTIQVLVNKSEFHLTWQYQKEGSCATFAQDRPSQPYHFPQSSAREICHYTVRCKEEEYFGLGEKSGHLKRNGRRFRFLNIDAMGYDAESTDPLYKHIPFILTRNRTTGIYSGFFYDNLSESVLDLGREMDNYHEHYRYYLAKSGDLDFYVFADKQIRKLIQTMLWLTRKTTMLPKWSLYYSGSAMSYTNNAQEQLYQFLDDCKKHDISCRSFQLSSEYTTIGNNIRCVFHWNTSKFPDFKKLAKDFMDNNIQFCANIKPAMLEQHPMYAQVKEKGIFIKEADTDEPELLVRWMQHGVFWPRYTVHSRNDDGSVNVPWMYKDYLPYTKQALALLGKLLSYIYDLLYRTHTQYEAILKPLFYDFQDDENCDSEGDNFLMSNIPAAPVIEKGAQTKAVYFPKGAYWYDSEGKKVYPEGTHTQLKVNLGSIPYFVREGTVLGPNTAPDGFMPHPEERIFEIYLLQKGEFTQVFLKMTEKLLPLKKRGF